MIIKIKISADSGAIKYREMKSGDSVVLTINRAIQYISFLQLSNAKLNHVTIKTYTHEIALKDGPCFVTDYSNDVVDTTYITDMSKAICFLRDLLEKVKKNQEGKK